MALIIMNDNKCYITLNKTGGLRKTFNIKEAKIYETLDKAFEQCRHNPKGTKGYYVYDTATKKIYHRQNPSKKRNRKSYSQDTRKLIYERAEGRCELCGKKFCLMT